MNRALPTEKGARKRVLFVSQVYSPSHDAVSQMNADLAVGLRGLGWDVHVLTNQVNYMTGERLARHEWIDGIRVWRTPCVPLGREVPFARLAVYGGFWAASGPAMALVPKPDAVVYLSTPPLVAWSARAARRLGRIKTLYWAQDVYPEVPVRMGYIKNPLIERVLTAAEKQIIRGMDKVVVIGDEMRRVFLYKGVSPVNVAVISNWSVVSFDGKYDRATNPLLVEHGLTEKFVVQYSGNMGIVHDMGSIAEAMVHTGAEEDIHWLMIGGGKRRAEIERTAAVHGLSNVTMLPYQSRESLDVSLLAADVSVLSLRPEMEGLVVPSKLFSAMAAGLPVIFVGSPSGEVARIIEAHGCGMTATNGAEIAAHVRTLKRDPVLRKRMGEAGRRAYESSFSRETAVRKFNDALMETLDPCES